MTVDELLRLAVITTKEAMTHLSRMEKLAAIDDAKHYLLRAFKLVNEGKAYETGNNAR